MNHDAACRLEGPPAMKRLAVNARCGDAIRASGVKLLHDDLVAVMVPHLVLLRGQQPLLLQPGHVRACAEELGSPSAPPQCLVSSQQSVIRRVGQLVAGRQMVHVDFYLIACWSISSPPVVLLAVSRQNAQVLGAQAVAAAEAGKEHHLVAFLPPRKLPLLEDALQSIDARLDKHDDERPDKIETRLEVIEENRKRVLPESAGGSERDHVNFCGYF